MTTTTTTTTEREPFAGPIIRTRYLGATNTRGSRIVATHKRDNNTTWRVTVPYDYALTDSGNHERAARALMARWPFGDGSEPFAIVGRGHDADAYYWLAVNPWQADRSGALGAIAGLLDGVEWSADTVSAIADLVRASGYVIADV